jgi:hypothetical protein
VLLETAPPPNQRDVPFFCHTSIRIPAADGVFAGVATLNGIYALTRSDADYAGNTPSRGWDVLISSAFALGFAVSAIGGASRVEECREATRDFQARWRARDAATAGTIPTAPVKPPPAIEVAPGRPADPDALPP